MAPAFLHQRLFPTLRLGFNASVTHNRHPGSVHSRQGLLDRSCGIHCAAIALSLLGRITYPGNLPARQRGIAARLWKAAQTVYFVGMDHHTLSELLSSLSAHISVVTFTGSHQKTAAFAIDHLASGGLAILSWSTETANSHHWVLAVGVEGVQVGRDFTASTLLVFDPLHAEPVLCGYNGRIHLNSYPLRRQPAFVEYVAIDGSSLTVTLTSAVAIHYASVP